MIACNGANSKRGAVQTRKFCSCDVPAVDLPVKPCYAIQNVRQCAGPKHQISDPRRTRVRDTHCHLDQAELGHQGQDQTTTGTPDLVCQMLVIAVLRGWQKYVSAADVVRVLCQSVRCI